MWEAQVAWYQNKKKSYPSRQYLCLVCIEQKTTNACANAFLHFVVHGYDLHFLLVAGNFVAAEPDVWTHLRHNVVNENVTCCQHRQGKHVGCYHRNKCLRSRAQEFAKCQWTTSRTELVFNCRLHRAWPVQPIGNSHYGLHLRLVELHFFVV